MSKHLQVELEALRKSLLTIGAIVEESVEKSIIAFKERKVDLAQEVIDMDRKIDLLEVEVEEECLKVLALHQPVAQDLRFISVVLKINNDLERMGDCASNVARRAKSLAKDPPIELPHDLFTMAQLAMRMVHGSIDAFVRKDSQSARDVCAMDDQVDEANRKILRDTRSRMYENPKEIAQALDVFTVSQRIERIADLATNIAEEVVYMVEGEIIRHRADEMAKA